MYGTHNVDLLSQAFAKATRAADTAEDAKVRAQFREIAKLIWQSCGSNAGRLSEKTKTVLGVGDGLVPDQCHHCKHVIEGKLSACPFHFVNATGVTL